MFGRYILDSPSQHEVKMSRNEQSNEQNEAVTDRVPDFRVKDEVSEEHDVVHEEEICDLAENLHSIGE